MDAFMYKAYPYWNLSCNLLIMNIIHNTLTFVYFGPPPREGGGGDDSGMKCLDVCVCFGSENVPLMKDTFGKKNILILKVLSAHLIPISWYNIRLQCIIRNGNTSLFSHFSHLIAYVDFFLIILFHQT